MHPRHIITINSFGRCGSNIIANHFKSANFTSMHTHNDKDLSVVSSMKLKKDYKIVVHTHNPYFVFNRKLSEKRCFNILVKRRDQFAQLASFLLTIKLFELPEIVKYTKHNKEFILHPPRNYSNIIPQITVEKELFLKKLEELVVTEQQRFNTITQSPIPYEILYYETFITNLDSLKKYTPDVIKYKDIVKMQKSPLQAKSLISNYDELLEWWKEYSN